MAKKKTTNLDDALAKSKEYDKESQDILQSFAFSRDEIGKIETMKRSDGWKMLNKRIREELHLRMEELIENDEKVKTLISLLKLADTKTRTEVLEAEIEKFLPSE